MHRRSLSVLVLSAALLAGFAAPVAAKGAPAADLAIARKGLLTIKDFPPHQGWSQGGLSKDSKATVPSCQPAQRVITTYKRFRVSSHEFKQSDTAVVDNTVYVLGTVKAAKAFLRAYQLPTERECLQQGTEKQVAGVAGAQVVVTDIDTSGRGDDGVGFAVTVTAPGSQATETLVLDVAAYRFGRAVIGFSFRSKDEPVDIQQDLINATTARLTRALG